MALTPSNMLELGVKAPAFTLHDVVSSREIAFSDVKGKNGTLVMFICKHCPYVIHVEEMMTSLANQYLEEGIGAVAISSNDAEHYPDDSPENMMAQALKSGFLFPYLYDEDQAVAKAYDAACTPDFYIFDEEDKLIYRGRMDESRPGNDKPITGADLKAAIEALLNGTPVPEKQYPSMGCNIKWKS